MQSGFLTQPETISTGQDSRASHKAAFDSAKCFAWILIDGTDMHDRFATEIRKEQDDLEIFTEHEI